MPDITAPAFTAATRHAKQFFIKQSGDAFRVSCEAVGNPAPEIRWYKDGLPFDADGIKYSGGGRSTLRLRNLMQVDSAVYTCQARNLIGAAATNFTLAVEVPLAEQPTVAGNGNVSVMAGDTASLQCRVSSAAPPHIKWLKKEAAGAPSDMYTITVGEDKYRVIHTGQDIPVGVGEYLNKLVIPNTVEADSGLYICFVTNSGGSFNYKPSYLRVYPANNRQAPSPPGRPAGESTPAILALVLCLGITVLLILVFIIVCVVRKSSKAEAAGRRSSPSSPETVRTLMPASRSIESNATIVTVTSNKFDQPLPPPPSMLWGGGSTLKSNNLYITGGGGVSGEFAPSLHENSSTNLLSEGGGRGESPISLGGNQYEVPYCYSVRTLDSGHGHSGMAAPVHCKGVVPSLSSSGGDGRYPFRQYPYFQYLSDYEAY